MLTTATATAAKKEEAVDSSSFNWLTDANEISHYTDTNLRVFGMFMIRRMADDMKVRPINVSSALVMMHRIFTFGRIDPNIPRGMYPAACLFLASKAEDVPVKSTKVALAYLNVRVPSRLNLRSMKEMVVSTERDVFAMLAGQIHFDHPQPVIRAMFEQSDPEMANEAVLFANDIYALTKLCVLHPFDLLTAVAVRAAELQLKRNAALVNDGDDDKQEQPKSQNYLDKLKIKQEDRELVNDLAKTMLDTNQYREARFNARHFKRNFMF